MGLMSRFVGLTGHFGSHFDDLLIRHRFKIFVHIVY